MVEGSDVVITFDLSGHPSPHSFLYFFNDIQLRVDEADSRFKSVADRDGSLLIRDVRRNNSGVYSLTARNSLGEDTAHTHLIVQCKYFIVRSSNLSLLLLYRDLIYGYCSYRVIWSSGIK